MLYSKHFCSTTKDFAGFWHHMVKEECKIKIGCGWIEFTHILIE